MKKLVVLVIIIVSLGISMGMASESIKKETRSPKKNSNVAPLSEVVPVAVRTINVSSSQTLKIAITNAVPGDHIILASGSYSLGKVKAAGTSVNPIVIEGASDSKSVIASEDCVFDKCTNVIVSGLSFKTNKTVEIKNSTNFRLTRNTFKLKEDNSEFDWVRPYETSNNIRIDHNLFEGKTTKGNYISFFGDKGICQYTRIDHNYFKDIADKGQNGTEAIRIGVGNVSTSRGFVTVEYNLFENCDGDAEIISSKTCDNIIRYNTVKNSTGSISLRQGSRGQVYNNTILGNYKTVGKSASGGIKVYGQDNSIHDNYIENCAGDAGRAAIVIDSGDADQASNSDAIHCRVYRAKVYNNILYNNTYGFTVGGSKYSKFSPSDCEFSNNIVQQQVNSCYDIYAETNSKWSGNIAWATGSAVAGSTNGVIVKNPQIDFATYEKNALSPSQVGPNAQ